MSKKPPTFTIEGFQVVRTYHGYCVHGIGFRGGMQPGATVHFAGNLHRRKVSPNFKSMSDAMVWLTKNHKAVPDVLVSNTRQIPDDGIVMEVPRATLLTKEARDELMRLIEALQRKGQ